MNKMKNVWYVHPYAGGPGIGRYSRPYFLAHHWKALGIKSTIFSPSFHHLLDCPQSSGGYDVDGVHYEFVDSPIYSGNGLGRLRNMFEFTWRLYRSAKKYEILHGRPDVIIASSPHPYIFLATNALARKYHAQSVMEVRDLWPLSIIELAGAREKHPFVQFTGWLERYAYQNADQVVSLLPLTRDHMVERNLVSDKWSYIPNGIDIDESTQVDLKHDAVMHARKLCDEGCFLVVYTGALGRPNHLDTLLEAAAKLRNLGHSKVKFLIAGKGEKEDELKKMVDANGLADSVIFFGQIPKSAVLGVLRFAHIGYISLRPEPIFRFGVSPNKLFDYMLAKLPIVFAVNAGNDPVSEAGCGIKVSPESPDEIARAIIIISRMDESDRLVMGARGLQYVMSNHAYESLAKKYKETLEKVDCLVRVSSIKAADVNPVV